MLLTLLLSLVIWIFGLAIVVITDILKILAMGIPTYDTAGKITGYKSFIEYIFSGNLNSNNILGVVFIFILVGIVLIGIFGVIKILVISFKGEDNNGDNTTPKIVAQRMIKGIFLTLAVPLLILFLNFITSNFTQLIYQATSFDNGSTGSMVTQLIFGFSQNGGHWKTTFPTGNIFEIGSGLDLKGFRDEFFYANGSSIGATVVRQFFGSSITFFNAIGLFFGCESDCFQQILNPMWFILLVILILITVGLGKGLLTVGKKTMDAVLLEVSFPIATSAYPIDNGKRTMAHIQAILTKLLGGTIVLFALNIYFIVVNLLGKVEVNIKTLSEGPANLNACIPYIIYCLFPTVSATTTGSYQAGIIGFAYVLIITMGAVSIQTAPELLGHLISDSSASMSASDERAVSSSTGSAIKTAGKLGIGALGLSFAGSKMMAGAGLTASGGLVKGVGTVGSKVANKLGAGGVASGLNKLGNLGGSVAKNTVRFGINGGFGTSASSTFSGFQGMIKDSASACRAKMMANAKKEKSN